jgi:hypothetical protein
MLFIVSDRLTQLYPAKDKGQSSIGVFDYLRLWAAESALQMRSVCWITTAFHGLRCHPLTCMLLNVRLSADSIPSALTIYYQ